MAGDDAGAGTAEGGATTAAPEGPAAGATAGDGDAEAMLAEAVSAGDGDQPAGDDPAAQLAALQKQLTAQQRHARTWETRAKANQDAAARLAAIEEASKTEAQKLADRAAAAEQRAAQAEGLYHRTLAAATYGLGPDLIDLLSGSTEDEVTASAEKLAAAINSRAAEQAAAQVAAAQAAAQQGAQNGAAGTRPPVQQSRGNGRPVESMRAGAAPAGRADPANGGAWLREMYDDLPGRK